MNLGLEGKFALITGGSHGIGKSIALQLANEGCNIAIFGRRKSLLSDTVKELKNMQVESIGLVADVLDDNSLYTVKNRLETEWGKIDILVNNVGGGGRWGKEIFEETPLKVWKDVYKKNVETAVDLTMWAIPFMRKTKWGRVVTIASRLGAEAGGRPWFNMAKAAQISFMKTLAVTPYLVRDGITFNSVSPGSIMIEGTGWEKEKIINKKKFSQFVRSNFPMARLGEPIEVASVVTFLCSNQASLVNGANILVDGGESRSF